MNVLDQAKALIYPLFDKLGQTKEQLIQQDDDWHQWSLEQLVNALERYCDRNQIATD